MTTQSQVDKDQAAWAAQQPAVKTLSADALRAFIVSKGITCPVYAFKSDYDLPSPQWLAGVFGGEAWPSVLNLFNFKYQDGSQECTEFAAFARCFAQNLQSDMKNGNALAFGEFYYLKADGSGGHAVNAAVWRDANEELQLGFFEPQPASTNGGFATSAMQPITLCASEIQSCGFCRF